MRYVLVLTLVPILVILAAGSGVAAASLLGTIHDSQTGSPIADANLRLDPPETILVSGADGSFLFRKVPAGHFRLFVTHVAYEPYAVDVTVGSTNVDLEIKLTPRTYYSDEIVVTGTRTPYLLKDVPVTTEVIRTEEARQTGAITVDEALESAVGINVDDNMSGVGVTLRGLDPTRVLVLVDSERIVGRVRGAIDLSQISLDNVEKIEVVKGVGSTLYGSDAIGGVVNIITRKPEQGLRLLSSSDYGSFNSYSQLAELQASVQDWKFQLGGRFDRTDGFDLIKETPHTNGLERSKRFNLDGKIERRLSPAWELALSGGFFTERKDWLESEELLGKTWVYDDEESNYRYSGRTKLFFTPNPGTQVDANFYVIYYDHLWEKFYRNKLDDDSRTEDFYSEASVVATHSYAPGHVVTMGGDWNVQWLESEEIRDRRQEVQSGDVYLQYEWKPLDKLTLLPGMRLEQHSAYGTQLNASINAMYNPHPRLRLRAFHGGGFRAPSIKELYFRFDHSAAGYLVEGGGEDLKPETSRNSTITLEYSYEGIGLHRLTYFYNHLDNLIEFDLVGFSDTYWRGMYRYQNVFKAYTRGLEWESQVRLNHSFRFSLSYTWLIAKDRQTGHWLLNRPEHGLKMRFTFNSDELGLSATAWGSWYSGKLWTPLGAQNDFDSEIWAPTRREVNLSVTKDLFECLQVIGRAENITNDVEPEFGYWPGRAFYIGLRYLSDNGASDK